MGRAWRSRNRARRQAGAASRAALRAARSRTAQVEELTARGHGSCAEAWELRALELELELEEHP